MIPINGGFGDGNNGGIRTPGQNAWGLFALTGGIGYYLLHKELKGDHDEGRDKRLD